MALPEPITRKEMYLSKAATGEGNVPPEPVTREEMYLAEIAAGGGGGGATSLNDLSDVQISNPQDTQLLVMNTAQGKFINQNGSPNLIGYPVFPEPLDGQELWNVCVLAGIRHKDENRNEYFWCTSDQFPLAYMLDLTDETLVATFNTLLSNVKTAAKSSGRAGVKIPYSGGNLISTFLSEASLQHMAMLRIGLTNRPAERMYFVMSSVDANSASFRADHFDADGIYHITAVFAESSAMLSCEYATCTAMG